MFLVEDGVSCGDLLRGNLANDIEDEEDRKSQRVLTGVNIKILRHASSFGIADAFRRQSEDQCGYSLVLTLYGPCRKEGT